MPIALILTLSSELTHTFQGIPVYINPLVGAGTMIRVLKDTPQEHIVADSFATITKLTAKIGYDLEHIELAKEKQQ